jgi:putative superfamily III holin-X
MPTHADQGLGDSAKQVSDHVKQLARLELQLAALELKRKLEPLGIGVGLLIGAAVVAFFLVEFVLAAATAGLALVVPVWGALLIMIGLLAAVIAALVLVGVRLIKRGTPPVPVQAIEEAKLTTEALKSNGSV